MKKLLSIMLSILMVVTMLPMAVMPASAAENESDGVIYCELGPWTGALTALKLRYSSDNSTTNDIVMEEVDYNIWKADLSTNNPAGWIVQFLGSNQSAQLSSEGTTIPEGKNCFRITEYNSSSGVYDGVWYQYPCTHTGGTATCITQAICDNCGESYGEVDADGHIMEDKWSWHSSEQHMRGCTICHTSASYEYEDHYGGSATCSSHIFFGASGQ